MSHHQLVSAVARSTGESPRTIRRLGFGLLAGPPPAPRPGGPHLAVDCPRCSARCPLPPGAGGPHATGECDGCDILFACAPGAIYDAGPGDETP